MSDKERIILESGVTISIFHYNSEHKEIASSDSDTDMVTFRCSNANESISWKFIGGIEFCPLCGKRFK